MPEQVGIEAGEQILTSGQKWPKLILKGNERARFHCLTTGNDANFCAARFHTWGEFPNGGEAVCTRLLTGGEEECKYCSEGSDPDQNAFGLWAWVYHILRSTDNPEKDGDPWKTTAVEGRTLFVQSLERPLLIWLTAGKEKSRFRQFSAEWAALGSLQMHVYDLQRVGEGLDTEYLLSRLKDTPIPPDMLDKEEVKNLPTVPYVFRNSSAFSSPKKAALGTDDLLGGSGNGSLPTEPASTETSLGESLI